MFNEHFTPWNLGPMRVISRAKITGMGRHVGLQLPDGSVVDITDVDGVQWQSLAGFAKGRAVTTVVDVDASLYGQVAHRVQVAFAEQRPYHATHWNCECLVNWLIGAPATSPTATAVAVLAVFAGIAVAAAR